jgi:pimeloyl-ACP methyl ester carboxylesterase
VRAQFVDIDGVSTRFLAAGSGDPVLLLHGFGMLADGWSPNLPALAERHSVCAPDLLGCGFTAPGRRNGAPPQVAMAAHLAKPIDRLKIDTCAQLTSFALPWAWDAYEDHLLGLIESLDKTEAWAWGRLGTIEVPALLLYGRSDPRGKPEWEEQAAREIPSARCIGFDAGGHFVNLEHTERVNALLREFLDGTRRTA